MLTNYYPKSASFNLISPIILSAGWDLIDWYRFCELRIKTPQNQDFAFPGHKKISLVSWFKSIRIRQHLSHTIQFGLYHGTLCACRGIIHNRSHDPCYFVLSCNHFYVYSHKGAISNSRVTIWHTAVETLGLTTPL